MHNGIVIKCTNELRWVDRVEPLIGSPIDINIKVLQQKWIGHSDDYVEWIDVPTVKE